jgi:5-formyltetrahydrofolate cyclo-ligase
MSNLGNVAADKQMRAASASVPAKNQLRKRLLEARTRRTDEDLETAAAEITHRVLNLHEIATAETVAAYVSTAGEPGTHRLLEALHHRGIVVLLPCLLDDDDLEWARYQPHRLRHGRRSTPEPDGERLGPGAITDADVVICPGVAGSPRGDRLGRGGGSYDRALVRTRPRALRVLLLYDDEVVDVVPGDTHDEPVDVIVTESRVLRTTRRETLTSASTASFRRA